VASIRCRGETVKTVRVFISGPYKIWEDCADLVISEVLTFLCGCGSLRAKIAIRTELSKGLSFSTIHLIDSQ
jgi:hypothetical protein